MCIRDSRHQLDRSGQRRNGRTIQHPAGIRPHPSPGWTAGRSAAVRLVAARRVRLTRLLCCHTLGPGTVQGQRIHLGRGRAGKGPGQGQTAGAGQGERLEDHRGADAGQGPQHLPGAAGQGRQPGRRGHHGRLRGGLHQPLSDRRRPVHVRRHGHAAVPGHVLPCSAR